MRRRRRRMRRRCQACINANGGHTPFLCSAHFEQTCFERGLHSQFGVAYKAMLLPDAIPTIFPLSIKKAGKAPTKKRGVCLSEKDSG